MKQTTDWVKNKPKGRNLQRGRFRGRPTTCQNCAPGGGWGVRSMWGGVHHTGRWQASSSSSPRRIDRRWHRQCNWSRAIVLRFSVITADAPPPVASCLQSSPSRLFCRLKLIMEFLFPFGFFYTHRRRTLAESAEVYGIISAIKSENSCYCRMRHMSVELNK